MAAHGMRRRRRVVLAAGVGIAACLALAGCTQDEPQPLPPPPSLPPVTPTPGLTLAISPAELPAGPLDRGTTLDDASGSGNDAVVVEPESGVAPPIQVVRTADAPGGAALKFGERCEPDVPCVRQILEVADAPGLNPGTRDFAFSAAIRLEPEETSAGSNVVQKGFSEGGGGQWKLQIDGEEGLPSCTVVAPGSERINVVKAERTVADSQWHQVECRRVGTRLSVVVDGAEFSKRIPAGIDLTFPTPVRIGGKSIKAGNDPFHGELTDVRVVIEQ